MSITDAVFLERFEDLTLAPEYFNHRGHLRLAWLYLRMYSLETAIDKVKNGISAYASSLGATEKFQHTLTEAIVRIMAVRLNEGSYHSFEDYLENNSDLVDDLWNVVTEYYSVERLTSDTARGVFLEPDIKPFL